MNILNKLKSEKILEKLKNTRFTKKQITTMTIVFLIICVLFLVFYESAESSAKKAVLERLNDPDSAKFGKFTLVDKNSACLTVNARNRAGGYVGNNQAKLVKYDEEWIVLVLSEISHDECVDYMVQRMKNK